MLYEASPQTGTAGRQVMIATLRFTWAFAPVRALLEGAYYMGASGLHMHSEISISRGDIDEIVMHPFLIHQLPYTFSSM